MAAMVEPMTAATAAHTELTASASTNTQPVTTLPIRKTWEMPRSEAVTTESMPNPAPALTGWGRPGCGRPDSGSPAKAYDPSRKSHVVSTNGAVSAETLHVFTTLAIASITTTEAAPQRSARTTSSR